MAKRTIDSGQRYRDVRLGIYGRLPASDWMVEGVHTGTDGISYARLVSVTDPTVRKTLAATVMVDPARFKPI